MQREEVALPRPHSWELAEGELNPEGLAQSLGSWPLRYRTRGLAVLEEFH